jgi:hypothetical protein
MFARPWPPVTNYRVRAMFDVLKVFIAIAMLTAAFYSGLMAIFVLLFII